MTDYKADFNVQPLVVNDELVLEAIEELGYRFIAETGSELAIAHCIGRITHCSWSLATTSSACYMRRCRLLGVPACRGLMRFLMRSMRGIRSG